MVLTGELCCIGGNAEAGALQRDSPQSSHVKRDGWLWNVQRGHARRESSTKGAQLEDIPPTVPPNDWNFRREASRCEGCGLMPHVPHGGIDVA
jgi:hypothetical protein